MTDETYLLVKLVNGEEVVGEVVSSDDAAEMVMYRPMLVGDSSISRYHFFYFLCCTFIHFFIVYGRKKEHTKINSILLFKGTLSQKLRHRLLYIIQKLPL